MSHKCCPAGGINNCGFQIVQLKERPETDNSVSKLNN
jgi:hypothetical protein